MNRYPKNDQLETLVDRLEFGVAHVEFLADVTLGAAGLPANTISIDTMLAETRDHTDA